MMASSSTLASRLSVVGSLCCLAQRYTRAAPFFPQPIHGKGWAGAIPQQALQASVVLPFDADTGIDRKPAVLIAQHVFGLKALQQATTDKGAQDASAQGGLRLGRGSFVDCTGRLEDHVRRCRLGISIIISISRHCLKHAVDHADMEVHMLVQARATTKLQCRLTCTQVMSELKR